MATNTRLHQGSRNAFRIYPSDPRAQNDRTTQRLQQHHTRNKQRAIHKISIALQQARDSALAQGTKITHKSQLAYWTEFCTLLAIDEADFGTLDPGARHPTLQQIREEESIFATLMAFVIACPRRGNAQNTASYALQCISTVRSHYEALNGGRPGLREGNRTGGQLYTVIRGFQKTNPSKKEARIPILQQHLRAIKNCLNLETNPYHRALWALWLTQWQGVLRSSDLIKRKKDAHKPWVPSKETHRVRLSADLARDTEGKVIGTRLKLLLKPNKTDQSGAGRTVKTFVIDENPSALSAGQAIRHMLEKDAIDDGREVTPLFRNPYTKKELTYEESDMALKCCLRQANMYDENVGTHSLRIGGATAYANANNADYAVSGFMGLGLSQSKDFYMHACAPRIDMAALEIGRAVTWEVAGRPGPVARYAS